MPKLLIALCLIALAPSSRSQSFGIATVGQPHPDFFLPKTDGSMGRLSDFRGKPILLFHFASW